MHHSCSSLRRERVTGLKFVWTTAVSARALCIQGLYSSGSRPQQERGVSYAPGPQVRGADVSRRTTLVGSRQTPGPTRRQDFRTVSMAAIISAERMRLYLQTLSLQEVGPGRYRCNRCSNEWPYRDEADWYVCPRKGCADWQRETPSPPVHTARRILSGWRQELTSLQPQPEMHAAPTRGRPAVPKVPPARIGATFQRLVRKYGHYPPDSDLADEFEVSKRTIVNWRQKGYLPPRPTQ